FGGACQCSVTVYIRDQAASNSPLAILCASNRTVQCGTAWTFDAPAVTGGCSGTNVTLTFSTVTNPLVGGTFSATRTWTATDACSNSVTCSQTFTNLDTT